MLYVKLFGAPSFTWNDKPFDLSRRQARALLYRLAADASPVPRSQLSFLFWPDVHDRKARQNLTRLLSYMRGALPDPDLLDASRDNIGLDNNRCTSDSRQFQRQLKHGDEASLAVAADLYQGTFLAGFDSPGASEYEYWLTGEQNRYERLYLDALAQLVEIRASAGDQQAAIDYVQRYLAVDDLAEEMHRRLIMLYGESGDRAAAQRQYEACLTILERELGVDPLPETQAAYQTALVEQAPAAVSPEVRAIEPKWTILPSLDLPLIGRDNAWDHMSYAFERYRSGGFIFISGEPGIGKSRLLREFASATPDHLVLTGNSYAQSGDLPYQPIVQALRLALNRSELWADIPRIWLAEAAPILPELAEFLPDMPEPPQVDPAQAQSRLFEALSQIMLGLAGRQPLLLCLDDLHWADEATVSWLEYLSGRLPGSQLCIMATYRPQEAQKLADLRQTLRRGNLLASISLTGLSIDAIRAILHRLATGAQSPDPILEQLAATIHQATAGNAYFVLETVRSLIENDQLGDPTATLPLPHTVREAIEGRLAHLDPLARQMIEAAAVLQPDLSLSLLGRTAGRSEDELVDAIEQLVGRQMLRPLAKGFVFQHELLRGVVYDGLSIWRQRMLHRRAAEALAELPAADKREAVARIASHFEAAGEAALAVSYYREAAQIAQARHAYREAGELVRRALNLLAGYDPDPAVLADLLGLLADSLAATGQFAEACHNYRQALAAWPTVDRGTSSDRVRKAELIRRLGASLKPQMQLEEADAAYDRALELLGPSVDASPAIQRAWLHIQLDRLDLYYLQARAKEMAMLTAAIEPVVRQLGDAYYLSLFYAAATRLQFHQERFRLSPETVRLGQERLANAQASGDPREIVEQQFGLGFILLWAGRPAEARGPLQAALAAAEEIDHTFLQVRCLAYLSILHRMQGDAAKVKFYSQRSREFADEVKFRPYIGVEQASEAWLAHRDGDWQTARDLSLAALASWENTIYPFGWLVNWILLAQGLFCGDLDQATGAAAAMLNEKQQRLSDEITAALEEVVCASESGDVDGQSARLEFALQLAQAEGYL